MKIGYKKVTKLQLLFNSALQADFLYVIYGQKTKITSLSAGDFIGRTLLQV